MIIIPYICQKGSLIKRISKGKIINHKLRNLNIDLLRDGRE